MGAVPRLTRAAEEETRCWLSKSEIARSGSQKASWKPDTHVERSWLARFTDGMAARCGSMVSENKATGLLPWLCMLCRVLSSAPIAGNYLVLCSVGKVLP
jgi:hypothetical protein